MPLASPVSPETESVLDAETQVDGFRILRLLGEGAMGQVYLAQDLSLGRRVALKLVKIESGASSVERFLEEARTTARFNHPHIVTVHATGMYRRRPYLALEYLDGESLRQRMARGRLGVTEALRICRAIAEALAEAHRHGIVHADLKPENVLLPLDGRVRVVDFGLARLAGSESGAASGTPAYMAPERWHRMPPTPAIDIWSLGVIAFELFEGRRPFDESELVTFAYSPRPLPRSPKLEPLSCAHVFEACLSVEPRARPSADAVVRSLSEHLDPGASRTDERSPYRGLRAFAEADAGDFFGREAEIDAFVERLRHEGLVPLVGPSGIGKSSFLQAGVIRRLRQLEPWTVFEMRPGPWPLSRLAKLLSPATAAEGTVAELARAFAERPGELGQALRRIATTSGGQVLLAFDAFEEAFTLASLEETRRLAVCLSAAASADERWRVVLVLRDEYLGQLARLEPLRAHLGAAFVLGPLAPASLGLAITGPLQRVGYTVDEPVLVERIVTDVQAQPAGLPLLQFACMALWERRDVSARKLLASVYDEMGGVGGALASHAQQMLLQLPAEDVRGVRKMLLRLVTSDGTRQPRLQWELMEALGDVGPRVLERLLANRLVVVTRDPQTDEPYVELAHESLATTWPDLARWLAETHEERALVQELEQAAQLWERRGSRDEETWTGDALRQALLRVQEWNVSLSSRPRAFLNAGERHARRVALRRRAAWGTLVVSLLLAAIGGGAAAVEFRKREAEAIRQQHEILLAGADIGEFEFLLEAYDFDAASQSWSPAKRPIDLQWSLAPAIPDGAPNYSQPELRRSERRREGGAIWRERVEAPSREAWLIVERGPCAPSRLRLRQLPGYRERGRVPLKTIRVPVPTCEASNVGMLEVPAGPYWRPAENRHEKDLQIDVPRYSIDKTEVTNGQFKLFEEILPLTLEKRTQPPQYRELINGRDDRYPVNGVNAFTSEAFCLFMGKSLPTVDQWRKAFRGGIYLDEDGKRKNPAPHRLTVWANNHRRPLANLKGTDNIAGAAEVGRFSGDVSPYGVLDMAGNVAEWTASESTAPWFKGLRQVAGGRWEYPAELQHHMLDWINNLPPERFEFSLGFRCARTSRPP